VGGVHDLVFRSVTGGEVKETVLNVELKRIGESIGVPGLHLHDLRHSYAVASLRAGVDVKTLQQSLGHASAAMTLDVYAAYTDDAAKAANDRLSAYFAVD
jgi:integrase